MARTDRTLVLDVARSARPWQWAKNLLVLLAPLFGGRLGDGAAGRDAALAFLAFSLTASAGYLVNDLVDRRRDAWHPVKSRRPLAAGRLPPVLAATVAAALGLCGLLAAASVRPGFVAWPLAYLALAGAYTLAAKRIPIVDVLVIASLSVLRVEAGGAATGVAVSPWLRSLVGLAALVIALGKRRAELERPGAGGDRARPALRGYDAHWLDPVLTAFGVALLCGYASYTLRGPEAPGFTHPWLPATLPLAALGIWRYLRCTRAGRAEDPVLLFVRDPVLRGAALLWLAAVGLLLADGGFLDGSRG